MSCSLGDMCLKLHVINPVTGRCVLRDSAAGRVIIRNVEEKLYKPYEDSVQAQISSLVKTIESKDKELQELRSQLMPVPVPEGVIQEETLLIPEEYVQPVQEMKEFAQELLTHAMKHDIEKRAMKAMIKFGLKPFSATYVKIMEYVRNEASNNRVIEVTEDLIRENV